MTYLNYDSLPDAEGNLAVPCLLCGGMARIGFLPGILIMPGTESRCKSNNIKSIYIPNHYSLVFAMNAIVASVKNRCDN